MLQGHGVLPQCPCPHPPPPGYQGRQVARRGGWLPPSAKWLGGRGACLRGQLLLGGLLRPGRARVERPVHAVAPHTRVEGGFARVIRAPGGERRVQGVIPVHREPCCLGPTRGLRLRHRRLPLRLRLLRGLGLLHVAFRGGQLPTVLMRPPPPRYLSKLGGGEGGGVGGASGRGVRGASSPG